MVIAWTGVGVRYPSSATARNRRSSREIVEVHPSVHQRLSTPRLNPEVRSGSVPDVPALMLGAEDVDSKVHLKVAILYARKIDRKR